jgi:hypothetical protein
MARLDHGVWSRYGVSEGFTGDYARFFAEGPGGAITVSTFNGKIHQFRDGRFQDLGRPALSVGSRQGALFIAFDQQGRLYAAQHATLARWEGGR